MLGKMQNCLTAFGRRIIIFKTKFHAVREKHSLENFTGKKEKAALETRAAFLMPDTATYVAGIINFILFLLHYAVGLVPNLLARTPKTPVARTGLLIRK